MTQVIKGQLEVDNNRGVIYFHASDGHTLLRICSLPHPIPDILRGLDSWLDITHMQGCSWEGQKDDLSNQL